MKRILITILRLNLKSDSFLFATDLRNSLRKECFIEIIMETNEKLSIKQKLLFCGDISICFRIDETNIEDERRNENKS